MWLGIEQIHNPQYSLFEKIYIAVFGMPIVGLRIRARNLFSLIPGGKEYVNILDAGSGPGVFAFELSRRFKGSDIIGVDLLQDSIESCQQIAAKAGYENVSFLHSEIEALPHQNFFNLVICVDILEHIEDDLSALVSLFQAISSEGTLVLHVPALYRRYPVWKKSLNFDVESHVRVGYRPEEIEKKVEKAGFSIIDSGFTYGFWETLANNLSYMITHARMERKILYALAFPFLNLISFLGKGARPQKLGAGIYVVAEKII